MKKIAITGSLGHIGSRFIHSLSPGDFDLVRIIDNLSTLRFCSLFNLPKGLSINFIEEDICSADLNSLFSNFDIVIHLAAITDATTSFDKKEEVEKVNFYGTEKVALACIRNGCKLIFPSTTSVYGVQEKEVDESCSIDELQPQSPYAESKIRAENLLQELGIAKGLDFVICRLGTIFGTSMGMRFHTAINKFCWQATMKKPITVWKTALHQKRPYLDLCDAVDAFRFIINNNLFNRKIYNVVTTNTTVNEIISTIKVYIPDISIEYVDTKIMNQLSYTVSNRRFAEAGFSFKGNLQKGICDTVELLMGIRN